jgi:hypothetical protein
LINNPTRLPPPNVALLNRPSGNIGVSTRRSVTMNAAVATTKITVAPITSGVMPACPPSISARVSAASASTPLSWATGSKLRGQASGEGTCRAAKAMAASPIGTLTKNTNRQLAAVTSTPPRIGPAAAAMPAIPPHTPIARARAAGSG